jgi:23S rRNA (guanosine2251-2'-O)-methyltransferase
VIVILHNIRSLHNVGSIFRTADAVGAEKLYLAGITPSPLDRFGAVRGDVAKTALGAEKTVPWESVKSTSRLVDKLRKAGYKIIALEQSKNSVPYFEFKLDSRFSAKGGSASGGRGNDKRGWEKFALILGAEVTGVPKTILEKADTVIEIPMVGMKESLNVAVSFGIVAFHLRYG